MEYKFPYFRKDPLTGQNISFEIVIEADDLGEAVELAVEEYYKDEPA